MACLRIYRRTYLGISVPRRSQETRRFRCTHNPAIMSVNLLLRPVTAADRFVQLTRSNSMLSGLQCGQRTSDFKLTGNRLGASTSSTSYSETHPNRTHSETRHRWIWTETLRV